MLQLPQRFLSFYFLEGLAIWLRVWFNSLGFLEEDLAVGLMFKLLFVPLFHDSSLVGRFLSFFFRSLRILWGLAAYLLATLVILTGATIWFLHPLIFIVAPHYWFISVGVMVFSLALFIDRVVLFPAKTLRHVITIDQLWQATLLKKSAISWTKLTLTYEVKLFLATLELTPVQFSDQQIPLDGELLNRAGELAKKSEAQYLTAIYFWVAMLERIPNVANQLLKLNLKIEDFYGALKFYEKKRNTWRRIYLWDEDFSVRHLRGTNRGWLAAPTPVLDAASVDLTKEAVRFGAPDFIGRQSALNQVINILSSDGNKNALIVGPVGSGKTALVKYLAKMIVQGNAPKELATKRLVYLQSDRLLSGVTSQGTLADKIKGLFDEIRFVENIIIFIDEIHNLGLGEANSADNLYSLLLPELESATFQFVATTEPENYDRIIEKDASLARIFSRVDLPPATVEEAIAILLNRAIEIERYQKIPVSFLAISEIVNLANRYIHDRVLPDSALSILEDCQTLLKAQSKSTRLIDQSLVKEVLGQRVNVPMAAIGQVQKTQLLNLEETIHQHFIDQEEAVRDVASVLRRSATDLRESTRPIGSFLFVGPTGVGKTELAKTLSDVYFKSSSGKSFVRFDMSEYQHPDSVNRLIGSQNEPGQLTETIFHQPYCLILLDEFEKAHPQILTLFLQVLEDGRLTDQSGKTVDFSNTIIIATSNAGSLTIAQGLAKNVAIADLKQTVNQELLTIFKPELINRFDELVIFKPLSTEDLAEVVKIKLADLKANLNSQGYLVEFNPELIELLAKRGFDPVLGARPLRRLIQNTLEARLSVMILEDKLPKGEPVIVGPELLLET